MPKDIEHVTVTCRLCPKVLGPMDRGIWVREHPICEECAHLVWFELLKTVEPEETPDANQVN